MEKIWGQIYYLIWFFYPNFHLMSTTLGKHVQHYFTHPILCGTQHTRANQLWSDIYVDSKLFSLTTLPQVSVCVFGNQISSKWEDFKLKWMTSHNFLYVSALARKNENMSISSVSKGNPNTIIWWPEHQLDWGGWSTTSKFPHT